MLSAQETSSRSAMDKRNDLSLMGLFKQLDSEIFIRLRENQVLKQCGGYSRKGRIRSLDLLFSALNGPHKSSTGPSFHDKSNTRLSALSTVYVLRLLGQEERSSKLEMCVDSLFQKLDSDCGIDVEAVASLLLCLADLKSPEQNSDQSWTILSRDHGARDDVTSLMYEQFASLQFDRISQPSINQTSYAVYSDVFSAPPGSLSRHSQTKVSSENRLFGALSSSDPVDIDVKLELPELQQHTAPTLIGSRLFAAHAKADKTNSTSLLKFDDQGFCEGVDSVTSSVCSLDEAQDELSMWAVSLQPKRKSLRRRWERVGCEEEAVVPYLLESGSQAVHQLCTARRALLLTMQPEVAIPLEIRLTPERLLEAAQLALIDVPSIYFLRNVVSGELEVRHELCISGVSAAACESLLRQCTSAGLVYSRLHRLSESASQHKKKGLVFNAMCSGIRQYLYSYSAAVMQLLTTEQSLLRFSTLSQQLISLLRDVASICRCLDSDVDVTAFPQGMTLVSLLYEACMESSSQPHLPAALHLFRVSIAPLITFVQDWVFHGICRDIYGEFIIKPNWEFLTCKDEEFWTHGFTTDIDSDSSFPSFLGSAVQDICICGKSINLLKMCKPQHPVLESDAAPRLRLCLTDKELSAQELAFTQHARLQTLAAKHEILSQSQRKERALREKRELLVRAAEARRRSEKAFYEDLETRRRAIEQKKQTALQELKQQWEDDVQRRNEAREAERTEDAARAQRQLLGEDSLSEHELLLKQQAREELIRYYEELHAAASLRERRAVWRSRRLQLSAARRRLLMEDEQTVNTFMNMYPDPTDTQPELKVLPAPALALDEQVVETPVYQFAPHVKRGVTVNRESSGNLETPSVRRVAGKHVSEESELPDPLVLPKKKPRPRWNDKSDAAARAEQASGIRLTGLLHHPSDESRATPLQRPTVKRLQQHPNQLSQESGDVGVKQWTGGQHPSQQSQDEVDAVPRRKRLGFYGHITQMSSHEYEVVIPKLRRPVMEERTGPWLEDWSTIQVQTRRSTRAVGGRHASEQTQQSHDLIAPRRKKTSRDPNQRSGEPDLDSVRLERFRQRNKLGHSSDSTLQHKLYPQAPATEGRVEEEREPFQISFEEVEVTRFQDSFVSLESQIPEPEVITSSVRYYVTRVPEQTSESRDAAEKLGLLSLHWLVQRSLVDCLRQQMSLVNRACVSYLLNDLGLLEDFQAMRAFFFMIDGEFSNCLANRFCTQPELMDSHVFLRSSLLLAISESAYATSNPKLAEKLDFTIRSERGSWPRLEFRVAWPNSILLNTASRERYLRVWELLLEIRQALATLDRVYSNLMTQAVIFRAACDPKLRRLQLYRHEMHHFVKTLQAYISAVCEVTWKQFTSAIEDEVVSVDSLIQAHDQYLERVLYKCLLTDKAASIIKVIRALFSHITRFELQLTSHAWRRTGSELVHEMFDPACHTFSNFHQYSNFLYKVIVQLASHGFQTHLQELLLRLNYNYHYGDV